MSLPISYRMWAEIDTQAFRENALAVKKAAGGACFFAVLKADAYGHGAAALARELAGIADGAAVATLDEAFELRASGYAGALAVLSFADCADFESAVLLDVILTVFSFETAKKLNAAAGRLGKKAKYFLAVDTGMTRLGLSCGEDGVSEAVRIASLPHLQPYCLFTHPACAELPEHPANEWQSVRFFAFREALRKSGILFPYHCYCNSAVLENGGAGTLCKIGLLLYGLSPSGGKSPFFIRPVLSLHARILRIRSVPAGTGIGYGHTYTAPHPMKIATLSAGYADGIPFSLAGRGSVLLCGRRAPIVGRICMDMMTVDATGIPGLKEEDTATLIGADGSESIGADETAELAGTVSYDILCSVGRRVPRVYTEKGKVKETVFYMKAR